MLSEGQKELKYKKALYWVKNHMLKSIIRISLCLILVYSNVVRTYETL